MRCPIPNGYRGPPARCRVALPRAVMPADTDWKGFCRSTFICLDAHQIPPHHRSPAYSPTVNRSACRGGNMQSDWLFLIGVALW